ncbi:probable nucleoporin Nup54 [Procambarus clarkii]|uniref:probable nucleoporin Nup54 n=1 Tax=Procambarus clarkii TaxID=6728 RepID=UPI003741F91A
MPVIQYIRASVSSPVNQYARILFSSNTGYCVMELSKESCGNDISEGAEEKKIKKKKDTTSTSKSIIVKIEENHIHSNDENVALRKSFGYYSSNMSPVEFTSENPYCRFKNLFIEQIIPMLTLTEQQMKKYLDTPQRGIDPALWELGKRKNPDPKKLIPVVKVGFQELQKQFKYQEEYGNKLHNSMKNIMDDTRQLSCMQTTIKAAIQNFRLKQTNIMRRVLKLVSAQEVERKKTLPLEETEDQIRLRLENLYMQLQDLKGCLNELMAQSIKSGSFPRAQRYGLVVDKVQDISQYLKWQQDVLQAIVNILKEDIQVIDSVDTPRVIAEPRCSVIRNVGRPDGGRANAIFDVRTALLGLGVDLVEGYAVSTVLPAVTLNYQTPVFQVPVSLKDYRNDTRNAALVEMEEGGLEDEADQALEDQVDQEMEEVVEEIDDDGEEEEEYICSTYQGARLRAGRI